MDPERGIPIPLGELSAEALRGVIEEFVTRDGTELSDTEAKIEQVHRLLRRGEAQLWYDPKTRSCNILESER